MSTILFRRMQARLEQSSLSEDHSSYSSGNDNSIAHEYVHSLHLFKIVSANSLSVLLKKFC